MANLAPIGHGFFEDDDGAPGLYVTEAGVVVLRSVQGGPLVPIGGGGGGGGGSDLTLARTGTLNFETSSNQYFDSDLVEGAVLIKTWANLSFDISWAGGGTPKVELVLSKTDGSDGTDLIIYDFANGFPQGGSWGTYELSPLVTPDPFTLVNLWRSFSVTGGIDGSLQVTVGASSGSVIAPFTGTYEVFALIAPPP